MASTIKGVIINYKVGPKTQRSRECIIQFAHAKNASEASRLIGRKVAWKTSKNNKIIGKIVALHGKKGFVRVRFRKGLPGQALGAAVELIG
ncbi:50S ribosomal protein L35ae [Candidatus Bathyarchaeota archaeon]|nr:50S ribosomal protein L35ae [Candidatus Bathyarchaeota archaeon]